MNRLSSNDKTWGPITLAPWNNYISARLCGGDEEDPENYLIFVAFGWALRIKTPKIIKPFKDDWQDFGKEYGFTLSKQDTTYDFFQIFYGPQTWSSATRKSWSKFLPWTQWNHVRTTIYAPDGSKFADVTRGSYEEDSKNRKDCPKSYFKFLDYDGTEIVAECMIEEREWHRGEGWFKWLKYFYKPLIRRDLDLWFNDEVGPRKGSWKGGTIGMSTDIKVGETPEEAFRRFCSGGYGRRGEKTELTFIGPCEKPEGMKGRYE